MEAQIHRAIVAIALRQQNNITREQLLTAGLGAKAIEHRARTGWLYRVHLTVYSLGRPPHTPHEKASAAVLACGPGAALSHASALTLWGLRKHWPNRYEVITTLDRRPKNVQVHLSKTLTRHDITRHFAIPVTTPARTLYDCASSQDDETLARAVNDALLSKFLTRSQLAEFLERCPCKRLAPFVATDDGPTRSVFEDAFVTFCRSYGLPQPRMNVRVAGHEVDALFEAEKLIVELDGYRFHSSRRSFERDRAKSADTLAAGFATVNLTWNRLHDEPDAEAFRLEKTLASRRR